MLYSSNFNFAHFEKHFIRSLKRYNYSPETVESYTKVLKVFKEYIYEEYEGKILIEQIQRDDILDYLSYLKEIKNYKPKSIALHTSTLKSFFNFLADEMNINDNVAAKVKHQRFYTPLPTILTEEEVDNLLAASKEYGEYFHVLISMLYFTGSRITALVKLRKDNINLPAKKIYFPVVKGGKDHYLPIPDKLFNLLVGFLNNHPSPGSPYVFHSTKVLEDHINPQTVRKHLRKIKTAAGIQKRVTPHILRHSMATHLTLLGVPQKMLMDILSQKDPRSTARYQHLLVDDLRGPLNKLKSEKPKEPKPE